MWLHHRLSRDIDLFFESAAALRLLSPNRNPDTKRITDHWQEPGHYLKFEVAGIGNIDILVTRSWLEPPSIRTTVSGTPMTMQRPAEILSVWTPTAAEAIHRSFRRRLIGRRREWRLADARAADAGWLRQRG
jgi:hypothetical protein